MNMALEHETECGLPCASCGREGWSCPYMGIACGLPREEHRCDRCDPGSCGECGSRAGHFFACPRKAF